MIYKWAMIVGIVLGMMGCAHDDKNYAYQIQGINAYRGQDIESLFNENGAPNAIKKLGDDQIMWIYYTNYRPVGGGELISYDNPPPNNASTSCMVRIILKDNNVYKVFTNCS